MQKWLPLNYPLVRIQKSFTYLVQDNKFSTIFVSKMRLAKGGSMNFFRRGCTTTSTPINHIVFLLQKTSCITKPQVISGRGGAVHPLHPLPRSAPVSDANSNTNNKQLLDEVEYDIMNYQNRGLCYLPKPKAEADNTDTRF